MAGSEYIGCRFLLTEDTLMPDAISPARIVLTTAANPEEAGRLARTLVEERLAACATLIPAVESVYRWKGVVEEAKEWMLIIKSRRERFEELRVVLEGAHSYELPEVLAIPVVEGSPNYLAWVEDETK